MTKWFYHLIVVFILLMDLDIEYTITFIQYLSKKINNEKLQLYYINTCIYTVFQFM